MVRTTIWLSVCGCSVLGSVLFLGRPADARREMREPGAVLELGRRLFMDPAVSRNGKFACADCHDPEHGFSDRRAVSEDENGKTRRHSQTLIDLVDGRGFHWDGEFDNIRQLLNARLAPPRVAITQANELHRAHFDAASVRGSKPDREAFRSKLRSLTPPYYGPETRQRAVTPVATSLVHRIQADGRYDRGFKRAFGDSRVTTDRLIDALNEYVLSIRSNEAPFDRFLAGDKGAIPVAARRGWELFQGKARCAACHEGGKVKGRLRFTDHVFRNTGVTFKNVRLEFKGFKADGGLGEMSFVAADLGKFKTPTLRDVAVRAPYMHDGSFGTLEEVVRYYNRGGTKNAHLHKEIRPLGLTDREVDDLVAFLKTLTSDERPALGRVVPHRPDVTYIRVVGMRGKPLGGLRVTVRPAGDRLQGAAREPEARELTTNEKGWIEFRFPKWTHVRLASERHEIGEDRLLPDYTRNATLIATPRHRVTLRLIAPNTVKVMPGRVVAYDARSSGKKVVALFKRVQRIGRDEAVYLSTRDASGAGRVPVRLDFTPRNGINAVRELDLSGGASETIDLRAEEGG